MDGREDGAVLLISQYRATKFLILVMNIINIVEIEKMKKYTKIGSVAELVDCTSLENWRSVRIPEFESQRSRKLARSSSRSRTPDFHSGNHQFEFGTGF